MSNTMNPLLIKVKLPGKVYALPSKGLFYPPGVLDASVTDGEIQVHPMSALAEMKLRSADLLFSGKVIREVCRECAPEILKPEALLTQDVDALFAFLRQVTYGETHTVSAMHTCDDAKLHEYKINMSPLLAKPNNSILAHRDEIYKITLSNEQIVHAKPSTYLEAMQSVHMRSEVNRLERENGKVDDEKLTDITIFEISAVVRSVEVNIDGKPVNIDNREHITEWIRALPRTQLDELLAGVKTASNWGFEFKAQLMCKDCGKSYEYNLELDPISFFFG